MVCVCVSARLQYPARVRKERENDAELDELRLEGGATEQELEMYKVSTEGKYWVYGGKFVDVEPRDLEVVFADAAVPMVYARSKRAEKEHPDYPPTVRFAISMARYLQDPLQEVAYMCPLQGKTASAAAVEGALGNGIAATSNMTELLNLDLHDQQRYLPDEVLAQSAERVLVEVTNVVGVDLLRVRSAPHAYHTVQFVAGLGPRKARQFLWNLGDVDIIDRFQLQQPRMLPKRIWENAIATLILRPSERDSNPFNATRIHPSAYGVALSICCEMQGLPVVNVEPDAVQDHTQVIQELLHSYREKLDGFVNQSVQRGSALVPSWTWRPDIGPECTWHLGTKMRGPAAELDELGMDEYAELLKERQGVRM